MKPIPIFITGQPRSGTSLLCEIVGHYPKTASVSQPLPLFFHHLKSVYNQQQNHISYYPITPLFLEEKQNTKQWIKFLDSYKFLNNSLKELSVKNQAYSGTYSSTIYNKDSNKKDFSSLLSQFAAIKEVFSEDFIPYFLSHESKTILIIRDPRDMIASLLQGRQMGGLRGFYYHLLLWRKSVAFALHYNDDSNFLAITLENLLNKLPKHLIEIENFLGSSLFPKNLFNGELSTSKWKSNSNCKQIIDKKIDNNSDRRKLLSKNQIEFIETICFVEMKALGYKTKMKVDNLRKSIYSVTDPILFNKKNFPPVWLWNKNARNQELQRLNLLTSKKVNDDEIESYFIFITSYKKLKISFG